MISNNTKVWLLLLLSSLLWLFFGYEFGDRLGLLLGFIAALLFNVFSFYHDETKLLSQLNANPVRGQDAWGLSEKVSRFSQIMNVPLPQIFVIPHPSINSCCITGAFGKKYLGFTSGLLDLLNEEELEAVVANQLCHTRRLDSIRFGVGNAIANSILGLGYFVDSFFPKNVKFFITLLAPVAWFVTRLSYGDKPLFASDLEAAKLLDSRIKLGEVLWRMEGLAQTLPITPPPCTSHLFMVNPTGQSHKRTWFTSHPEIEVRLKRLLGYYPI